MILHLFWKNSGVAQQVVTVTELLSTQTLYMSGQASFPAATSLSYLLPFGLSTACSGHDYKTLLNLTWYYSRRSSIYITHCFYQKPNTFSFYLAEYVNTVVRGYTWALSVGAILCCPVLDTEARLPEVSPRERRDATLWAGWVPCCCVCWCCLALPPLGWHWGSQPGVTAAATRLGCALPLVSWRPLMTEHVWRGSGKDQYLSSVYVLLNYRNPKFMGPVREYFTGV